MRGAHRKRLRRHGVRWRTARATCGLALVLAAGLLGGCDVDSDVSFTAVSTTDRELDERVQQLEAELAAERERANQLQAKVVTLEETNQISLGDKSLRFRLNTQAAIVLITAILALVAFFIARMKYAPTTDD